MAGPIRSSRRLLASRGVVALFGLQMVLFVGSLLAPVFDSRTLWMLFQPVVETIQFVNSFTDNLFAPGYNGLLDPLSTLLFMPFLCYFVAMVLAYSGRIVGQRIERAGIMR